jgi:serine protease Do
MSTRKTTLFYVVLIAVASAAVGMVISAQWGLTPASTAQTANVPVTNSAPIGGPIDATTFRNIARTQAPVVVNIQTTARMRNRDLTEFFGGDDPLRRFFGQPDRAPRSRPAPRGDDDAPLAQGAGTGFIIDKSGLILTNNHVVEGAEEIKVGLFGARNNNPAELVDAKVIGRDELTDSALIQLTQLPEAALTEAKFGDSNQMQPGDWVMAIGNPFNLSHTVTVGVVSAIGRPFYPVPNRPTNMIQTDAAINPGNSGGPLLNVRGEVVGINTAIMTDQQRAANIGIGFATPINVVRDLLPQLRTGKVTRGVIGVSVQTFPLTKQDAQAFGLPNTNGAVINAVGDGPASRAGIKPGDVIVEFNGRPVKDSDALVSMVVATKPGTTVPVTIYRNKERKTLNITVDELNLDTEQRRTSRAEPDAEPTTTGFGMTIEPLTPDIIREVELPRGQGGAIVSRVTRGGAASNAGVQQGDIILEVNRTAVNNVSQVTRELQNVEPGGSVFLLVWRVTQNGPQQQFLTMRKR